MDRQIIVYEPNEQVKMEVRTDGETVWLTIDHALRPGKVTGLKCESRSEMFVWGSHKPPEEVFKLIY